MSFQPFEKHQANHPTGILGYTKKQIVGTEEFAKNYRPHPMPTPLYLQDWNKNINAKTEFSFRPYQTFLEFSDDHYLNHPIYGGHGILSENKELTIRYLNKNNEQNNAILKSYDKDFEILSKNLNNN